MLVAFVRRRARGLVRRWERRETAREPEAEMVVRQGRARFVFGEARYLGKGAAMQSGREEVLSDLLL